MAGAETEQPRLRAPILEAAKTLMFRVGIERLVSTVPCGGSVLQMEPASAISASSGPLMENLCSSLSPVHSTRSSLSLRLASWPALPNIDRRRTFVETGRSSFNFNGRPNPHTTIRRTRVDAAGRGGKTVKRKGFVFSQPQVRADLFKQHLHDQRLLLTFFARLDCAVC